MFSVTQSCLTLCYPVDCSSWVQRIIMARILEWAAISSSKRSSRHREQTCISSGSYIGRWIFTTESSEKSIYSWILFARIFVINFWVYIHQGYGAAIFFSWNAFLWFCYQGNRGLIKWIWKCCLLFEFLEKSEKDWCWFFLKCLVEFTSEAI